jgi:hypothetical protein
MWVQELKAGLKTVSLGSNLATFAGATDPVIAGDMSVIDTRLRGLVSAAVLNSRNVDEPAALREWSVSATPTGNASNTAVSTVVNSGISTVITQGPTHPSVPVLSTSDGQYKNYRTGGVNVQTGWRTATFNQTQRRFFPTWTCIFRPNGLGMPTRFWVGVCSGNPSGADTGTLLHLAALHISTSGAGTWSAVTNDGSAGANFFSSGFGFSQTGMILTIQLTDTIVRFTLRNASGGNPTVVTTSTQMPGLTTGLGFVAQVTQTSGAFSGIGIRNAYLTQGQVAY